MTTTLLEQYDHALREFGSRVEAVAQGQWSDPTPCSDWDVRELVAHVVEMAWRVPHLLSGAEVPDRRGEPAQDPRYGGPAEAWRAAAAAARAAFAADGALDRTVSVASGEMGARDYLWEMTVGITVHAWDLARAIGADERLDPELVRRIHSQHERDPDSLAAGGAFAPPVQVAAHADLQARMLGLMGRRT